MIADTSRALYVVEKYKGFLDTPIGIFIHTVVTEIVGMLILVTFLSTVMAPQSLPALLPAILAFSGAAGGFKMGNRAPAQVLGKTGLIASAVLLTLAGCAAIPFFCPWEPILDPGRCLVSGTLALTFSFFGSWIARKHKRLMK